jgi:hypothetical protein
MRQMCKWMNTCALLHAVNDALAPVCFASTIQYRCGEIDSYTVSCCRHFKDWIRLWCIGQLRSSSYMKQSTSSQAWLGNRLFVQLANKFSVCYGKWRFVIVFTEVLHWTASSATLSSPHRISCFQCYSDWWIQYEVNWIQLAQVRVRSLAYAEPSVSVIAMNLVNIY